MAKLIIPTKLVKVKIPRPSRINYLSKNLFVEVETISLNLVRSKIIRIVGFMQLNLYWIYILHCYYVFIIRYFLLFIIFNNVDAIRMRI